MSSSESASVDAFLESPQAICALTYKPLDVQCIIASVHDEAAGATAIFIGLYLSLHMLVVSSLPASLIFLYLGTTRNSFKGLKNMN